jgi:solute carrier family 35 protein F5
MQDSDSKSLLEESGTSKTPSSSTVGPFFESNPLSSSFPISSTISSRNGRHISDDHSINRYEYDSEPYTDLDELESPNDALSKEDPSRAPSCRSSPLYYFLYQLKRLAFFVYNQLRSLTRRWIIGIVILLIVNFIWAASSIAVQALFSGFDKPFFLTYFSTSLFSLFLSGFVFLKSWRDNDSISDQMSRSLALPASETEPLMVHSRENNSYVNLLDDSSDLNTTRDQNDGNEMLSHSTTPIALSRSGSHRHHDYSSDSTESSSDSGEGNVRLRTFEEASAGQDSGFARRLRATHTEQTRLEMVDDEHLSLASPLVADEKQDEDSSNSRAVQSDLVPNHSEENADDPVVPIMKVKQVALLALQFLPIWFVANVTFNWSLRGTSVTSNSIISTTSSFWTLLFCHIFKVERFTILRVIALVVTISGVSVVAFSDQKTGKDSLVGDTLAIISAVCYGLYASFLRIKIKDEKQVKMAMFFGFVGFFNLVLMWPVFFILHFSKLEVFELPSLKDTLILTVNGLIGTVLSDLLWSLVIFLTSATVATVGLSLNVPFSLILDIFVKRRKFPAPYYVGAIIVLIGFLTANLSQDIAQAERKEQSEQEPQVSS